MSKEESTMSKAFLCHSSLDSEFVRQVAAHLARILDGVFFYEEDQRADEAFNKTISEALARCDVLVVFVGQHSSEWQVEECLAVQRRHMKGPSRRFFVVFFSDRSGEPFSLPDALSMFDGYPARQVPERNAANAQEVSAWIARGMDKPWVSPDGLPLRPHLFDYEKDIISFFDKAYRLDDVLNPPPTGGAPENLEEEKKNRQEIRDKILDGCPARWPEVPYAKPVGEEDAARKGLDEQVYGSHRLPTAQVVAAALSSHHADGKDPALCMLRRRFSFPEAGPRERLCFPRPEVGPQPEVRLRTAILVSGGIAPGINAVIDGIVQRHWTYAKENGYGANLRTWGIQNGFLGLQNRQVFEDSRYLLLPSGSPNWVQSQNVATYPRKLMTSDHASEGGSILGTSRTNALIDPNERMKELGRIVSLLRSQDIDILYVVGGDGSMKAAHALWSVAQSWGGRPLSVVGVPKTMDNDILWVWQAFGFLSAVEKAREVVEHLHTEVVSNPRLCILQLFGSDSGYVVSHAVLASATGHCDVALIPEVPFSMEGLARWLSCKMCRPEERGVPHGLVVMAETAIPTDAMDYVNRAQEERYRVGLSEDEVLAIEEFDRLREKNQHIQGQTSDALRSAGLKIVSRGLPYLLKSVAVTDKVDWGNLRVFTNEPRHILRAIRPSCLDIIMGQRLGTLAVDNAMAGYTDFMISQWLTEYVLVPLQLVVLGRKRIPKTGIFWKSVLAKTGQPANLV